MGKLGFAPVGRAAIQRINGERCVYQGDRLVAHIYDHRGRCKADACSGIRGDWGVAWISGRYDWHNTYAEARANTLKSAGMDVQSSGLAQSHSEIERVGFKVVERGDSLYVADPVYLCGHERVAGGLLPAGFVQVKNASQQQEQRFWSGRS